jgi:PIN like domain/Arm DNA-binding domain/Phage integrase, N-terminal SAM-like domain
MKRGSTWSVVLDVGPDPATGRRRQKWKGGFRTRKAAEAALRELSASVDSGRYVQRSTTSVGDYLDEWLEVVRPRLRPTSWNSYRMPVERMKGRAGAIPLQSLTPLDIESLYKELLLTGRAGNRPLSSKTVRNTHIVLRKALPDAERLGLEAYLRRIQYADDGYPELIHVPAYEDAQVVVDPTRGLRCSGLRARRRACRRTCWSGSGPASRWTSSAKSLASRGSARGPSCVSHPDGLPDLFLDRSLGRIKVPRLLRAAGLRLTTLAENYGIPTDERVADDDWLELAGSRGWVVFMKDTRIRYNRPEREAVKAHSV